MSAMYGSTGAIATSSESQAHLPHGNVLAHQRAVERPKRPAGAKETVGTAAGATYTPNAYMLLLSRLDNMVRRNELDQATLEQLRNHVVQHLALLPAHSRLKIQQLEDYGALGVEKLAQLPDAIVRTLRDHAKAASAMNFLKQPDFVAYMRDEPRGNLYGANGVLRAS
jgi:hypothetical protein